LKQPATQRIHELGAKLLQFFDVSVPESEIFLNRRHFHEFRRMVEAAYIERSIISERAVYPHRKLTHWTNQSKARRYVVNDLPRLQFLGLLVVIAGRLETMNDGVRRGCC
jgi:hypothetical protein